MKRLLELIALVLFIAILAVTGGFESNKYTVSAYAVRVFPLMTGMFLCVRKLQ